MALVIEMVHTTRLLPLEDQPPLDDSIRLWSGSSGSYWEGDTLVVETLYFSDLTQSFNGVGTAVNKRIIERFTRTEPYALEYEFTVEDPATFKDKVTAMIPMVKVNGQIHEYACHEENYGMVNLLRGQRMAEVRVEERP